MKEINKIILNSRKYFIAHQPHILFLFIMGFAIYFLSTLPYFNIIFFPEGGILIFVILLIYVLKLGKREVLCSALFLLILVPLFLTIKNNFLAEKTGDIAFFIFIIGFVQNFWEYLKEIKSKR